MEKSSSQLNRHRAYIGLRGSFSRVKILGWELVRFQSLKLRLARSLLKGLVRFVFLLPEWLVFLLSWSGADLALDSGPKCVGVLVFFFPFGSNFRAGQGGFFFGGGTGSITLHI